MKKLEAAVVEQGAGVPVILVHGAPSSPAAWAPIATELSKRAKVITVALPGYAGSPAPERDTVRQQEEALIAATARFGRAVWVGFSFGGNRILRLAAEGLIDPLALHSLAAFAWFPPEVQAGMQQIGGVVRALPDFKAEPLRTQLCAPMLSAAWLQKHPESLSRITSWADTTSPSVLADELDFAARLGPYDVSRIKVPVVARTGTLDLNVPAGRSDHLKEILPQTRVEKVDGAAHAMLIEDVAGTTESIRQLLHQVS